VKDLIPDHPNQIWVSDITYQVIYPAKDSADCDFVYLSLITDAYTKSIKGWSVGDTLETKYPLIALKMALRQTGTENIKGLIHHSDRGVQYASFEYIELLKKHGISISMTESGDPKDNAIAERSNETLKDELFRGLVFRNIDEVREAMQKAVDFYNNSSFGSKNYQQPAILRFFRRSLQTGSSYQTCR
jgi:transposase InsO family protein